METGVRPFDLLPDELLVAILAGPVGSHKWFHLRLCDRWAAAQACRRWRAVLADCGARQRWRVERVRCMPDRVVGPFLQGSVLTATGVASMAKTSIALDSIVSLSLGVRGCNEADLAKALVASDTVAGVERALVYATAEGADIDDSSLCFCTQGGIVRRSGRCVMLAVAARCGASTSVEVLIRGLRLGECIRTTATLAVANGHANIVRVLVKQYRFLGKAYGHNMWMSIVHKDIGPVVLALLDAERSFGENAIASAPGSAAAAVNPWSVAREESEWIAKAARYGTVAAIDLCRERGIAYDARALFGFAIRSGQAAFCDALLGCEPPDFVDVARATLSDSIDSHAMSVKAIAWSLGRAWFEPSVAQAVDMAHIVCCPTRSCHSGARALVDLVERWPREALGAIAANLHCIDWLVHACAMAQDADTARALSEALARYHAEGLLDVRPVDLWERAISALTREVSTIANGTYRGIFASHTCCQLLCWMRLLAEKCAIRGPRTCAPSNVPREHTEECQAWRRICMPRPLPRRVVEQIVKNLSDGSIEAMAAVVALVSVDRS